MPYTPNPQHRNAAFANVKSQWSIGIPDEQLCYQTATTNSWASSDSYWGIHTPLNVPIKLGISPFPDSFSLHIAKFVGDAQGNWHGYPVAHWLSPYDKPDVSVLRAWLESGFISRPTMAKIHRGKRCSL